MPGWVQLGLLGCALPSSCAVLLHDPLPLTEYYDQTLKDYKGLSWKNISPENAAPMTRVKRLDEARFKELVRYGYPFIVDDCVPEEAELREFPCSEYGKRWPNEHMRAEYTRDQHHIYLKESDWHSKQKPTATAAKHLSRGKPLSGPYIWHVKDETEDQQTKRDLQKIFPVPYFLNASNLNHYEAQDSFEFWYVLENGGSQAHADAYCETTISMQLRGSKQWRLGAFPNITNAFQPYAFHDAEIYGHDGFWRPEHEELVGPGSCVVFPMGYIHETYVSEGHGGTDGCSVASTFQFQDPQPVYQWKNFLTRWGLSHYARDEPCLERMEPYVYLGQRFAFGQKAGEDAVKAKCQERFQLLDTDGDGGLSLGEILPVSRQLNGRWRPPWTEARSMPQAVSEARKEKVQWMAEDSLLFHDDDRDGRVTIEEFQLSVLKFEAVKARTTHIERSKRMPAQLFEQEKQWIRQHICTSGDCDTLERLDSDYGRIMGKKPGKKPGAKKPSANKPGASREKSDL